MHRNVFVFPSKKTFSSLVFFLLVLCANPVFSKTVLDRDFNDYFPREIFKNFPVLIQSFSDDSSSFDFIRNQLDEIPENDEEYEVKLAYKFSNLPKIAVADSSDLYKYRDDFSMRFFTSEYSTIAIQTDPDGIETRVFKSEDKILVKKYDGKGRLFNESRYKENEGSMESQVYYFFSDEESRFPYYSMEKNYGEKIISKTEYTENFFVSDRITFNFSDYDAESDADFFSPVFKKKNFISEESFEYDEKNRVTKSVLKKGGAVVKAEFDYSKQFRNPDEIVYENDVKKTEKIFETEEDYSYEVYLKDGYSVKTVYKNYLISEEQFYKNGNLLRKNSFEKESEKQDESGEV